MELKKLGSLVSMGIVVLGGTLVLSSCTCKVNEEQLAKLADIRKQEKTLNSEISEQQNAKSKVDRELQARTNEANDCNGRRDIVKQRLSSWPNIWPDYTPQQ
jgi:outer membrane murein-binding lipoprotein Lpp